MRIVGFGASSMAGIGDREGGGFFQRVENRFPEIEFANLGKSGDTTRDMLERIGELRTARDYHLVVLLGCNDVPRNPDANPSIRIPLNEYGENLDRIFSNAKGVTNLFITSFPVDAVRTGVDANVLDSYVQCSRSTALRNGFEILDLNQLVATTYETLLARDGLHFNSTGHVFIADRLEIYLGDLLAKIN